MVNGTLNIFRYKKKLTKTVNIKKKYKYLETRKGSYSLILNII